MKGKSAKKLRRLAKMMTIGKTKADTDKVYERLKATHKANRKEI